MVRPPLSARRSVENPPPMGLDRIDYAIIAVYLIGVAWVGTRIGGRQRSSQDYFLGLLSRRPKPGDAFAGFLAGIVAMALILMLTQVDYTWHTLIGCLVTVGVGHARARLRG